MRDVMLILHFIGLAMGLGTSFAHMFLGMAAAKMPKEEALQFTLKTFAISKMGHIGLVLLVVTGLYMVHPFISNLPNMPLLIAKLVLVLVLGALIGIIGSNAKKALKGNAEAHLKKIETLGKFSFLVAMAIVVLAVKVFH